MRKFDKVDENLDTVLQPQTEVLSETNQEPEEETLELGTDEYRVVELPKTHVLFHDDHDGWMAGAIAISAMGSGKRTVVPRAVQYGQPFPDLDLTPDCWVIVLDFSYKREILDEVFNKVEKLVVLDHHETAMKQLEGAPYATFDMTVSGAVLAWRHFVPQYSPSPNAEIVDCYDMWRKDHPVYSWSDIRRFYFGCSGMRGNLDFWVSLANSYTLNEEVMKAGAIIEEQFLQTVEDIKLAPTTQYFTVNGRKLCIFHCEEDVSLISDAIYSDKNNPVDFTACIFKRDDKWVVSLRSPNPEVIAVNTLAEKFDGGGHRQAAGFSFPYEELDQYQVADKVLKMICSAF